MKHALYAAVVAVLVAVVYFAFQSEAPADQPGAPTATAGGSAPASASAELAPVPDVRGVAAVPEPGRPTVPDQLELRTQIAEADTRLMSALEAAYERVLADGAGIDGWIDETGMVQHLSPLPPEPRFVRQLDLPGAVQPEPGPDEKGGGGDVQPKRVRTLVLTQANAPEVFALEAELASLRSRLR